MSWARGCCSHPTSAWIWFELEITCKFILDSDAFLDQDWGIIRDAVRKGELGPCHVAKASTFRPNLLAASDKTKVICIYTSVRDDERQLVRVKLRELGVVKKIPWKADVDTFAGYYGRKSNCIFSD